MKLKKIGLFVLAAGLIALVAIRLVSNKKTTLERVFQYNREQAVSVKGDTIRLQRMDHDISFSGLFEPNRETRISSEIQGKIDAVLVDPGSTVRKGQLLIRLDNSLLQLQLQSINVQIAGLEADVKRYTVLAGADAVQGVQLEKARLGLESAVVQKAVIMEQINKSGIKAPFGGIVTAKLTEEGAFAAPGVPLLQITDIGSLKFTININENDLAKFTLNQSDTLSADAYPNYRLPGKVTMIGSKANAGNSFPVQYSVANSADFKIKSGMFGKVETNRNSEERKVIIQASALVGTTLQPQVYVVKMGKAVLQSITIAERIGNRVVLASGLNEGDVIITNGFINLFEGANVNLK